MSTTIRHEKLMIPISRGRDLSVVRYTDGAVFLSISSGNGITLSFHLDNDEVELLMNGLHGGCHA